MNKKNLKSTAGVTLIELLIALVISAILVAGIYRVFIHQQRTYRTQEDVADMQQNVRVAINRMIREIRMAGFGGKNENTNGNNDIINVFGNINGFTDIINAVDNAPRGDNVGNSDEITIVAAYERLGILNVNANVGDLTITVAYDSPESSKHFNIGERRYLCIAGRDNYEVTNSAGNTLTLNPPLRQGYVTVPEISLFVVRAINYGLRVNAQGVPVLYRNIYPNTGLSQRDTVAEYIEDLQFRYVLADTTETDIPGDPKQVRGVRINLTARTQIPDPELKTGEGFRRRTLRTYIDLRNLRDETP